MILKNSSNKTNKNEGWDDVRVTLPISILLVRCIAGMAASPPSLVSAVGFACNSMP
jgi:hypothetical protein